MKGVVILNETMSVHEAILHAAEIEFLEKGFQNASLRNIVKEAGVTTGAFYRYYPSKDALFAALVEPHANYVKGLFLSAIETWNALPDTEKPYHMDNCSGPCIDAMLDYIYEHYTNFKLLICSSSGTTFENFIHDLVEEEISATFHCSDVLRSLGYKAPDLDRDLCHMVSSALFSGVFEIVVHDMDKDDAKHRVAQLQDFFNGGWSRLMNFEFR